MGSPECIALVQEATRRLGLRQFHDAIELATRAIRLDPRHAPAYLVRAMALRKLNQADRALVDLTLAIRLEPDRPTPYVIRAEILAKRCQFDQAVADATQALFLDPGNAAAYSVRAQCRHALGDQEGAAEDVQQMLLIDPTRPVPDLGARSVSDPSPATATDDERFWKQAGGRDDERALFADGKPVDKTYRSRPAVGDEEAPEVLGISSGYKPEVITPPLPRTRTRRRAPARSPWPLAVLASTGVAILIGILFVRRASKSESPPTLSDVSGSRASTSGSARATMAPSQVVTASTGMSAERWTDLLPFIDPARDSFGGRWLAVEGGLISPDGGSLIHVPYPTPDEYRIRLRIMKGSEQMVGIGLVTGPTQHLITIDSYPTQGCVSKFDVVDGLGIVFHRGRRALPMHEVSTVVCTVRKNSIGVECNGRELGRWEGDFRRLSVHPAWAYGPKTGLFVVSVGKGTVIKGLDLLPLSEGRNSHQRPSGAPTTTHPQPTFLVTRPRIDLRHNNGWWSENGELLLGGLSGNPMARRPFLFQGQHSRNGIYLCASSAGERFITYRIGRKFDVFQSEAVVPEMFPHQGDPRTPLVLKVQGDGRTLWSSRPLARKGDHEPCSVSVAGIDELSLRVECRGADNWGLAAWVEPRLFVSNPDPDAPLEGE